MLRQILLFKHLNFLLFSCYNQIITILFVVLRIYKHTSWTFRSLWSLMTLLTSRSMITIAMLWLLFFTSFSLSINIILKFNLVIILPLTIGNYKLLALLELDFMLSLFLGLWMLLGAVDILYYSFSR